MTRRFAGWPPGAYDVLLRLDGEPGEDVRRACRRDRERLVRAPMIDLFHDLADADPAYEDFHVWGYSGKLPYGWQHQNGIVVFARNVELSLSFDLDGLSVAGGWGWGTSDQLARYRAAVADPEHGPVLERIVIALLAEGFELSERRRMKRPPRGFAPDHPRIELLLQRELRLHKPLDGEEWVHTAAAFDHVRAAWDRFRPLTDWLTIHVSPRAP